MQAPITSKPPESPGLKMLINYGKNIGDTTKAQVYSPARLQSKMADAETADKENGTPNTLTPQRSTMKRKSVGREVAKPRKDSIGSASKTKKVRKSSTATVDDIQKFRDEQAKIQEDINTLTVTISKKDQEIETLKAIQFQLSSRLKEEVEAKEALLSELSNKSQQTVALERERSRIQEEAAMKLKEKESECVTYQIEKTQAHEMNEALKAEFEEIARNEKLALEKLKEAIQLNQNLKTESSNYKESVNKMQESISLLKQRFFFSCAIALKLSLHQQGTIANVDANELYREAHSLNVPFENWYVWMAQKIGL